MKLTPIDIEQQRFRTRWRGYDPREVQQFLEMVAAQTTEMASELGNLREQLHRGERAFAELQGREESLRAAMVAGQRAIEEAREGAIKEAQRTQGEAELRAEKLLQSAHVRVSRLQEDIFDLQRQRVRFLEEMRGVVNTHARLLDVHADDAPAPVSDARLDVLERLRAPRPPGAGPDDRLT